MSDYPVRAAITRRFTLGVPRDVSIVGPEGGRRVLALRSDAGDDPVTHLWCFDPGTGQGMRLLDARVLGGDEGELPPEERARRERAREQAGGVTAYTVDRAGATVACALAGQLVLADVASGSSRVIPLEVPVYDPRISPDGRRVALHHDDGVSVLDLVPDEPVLRRLVEETGAVWGRAEFIAAEEMGRMRGMWWSPCSTRLAVTRFDDAAVRRVYLADLARPDRSPTELAYPFAGTPNAVVDLAVIDVETGQRRMLDLAGTAGSDDIEYLARVAWDVEPLLVGVQPRDQRALQVLALEGDTLRSVRRIVGDPWVELVPGSPAWLDGLLTVEDVAASDGSLFRALCRDGVPQTPPSMEVRALLAVHRDEVGTSGTVVLSVTRDDPTCIDVATLRLWPGGNEPGGNGPGRNGSGGSGSGESGTPADPIDVRVLSPSVPGVHHAVLSVGADGAPDVVVTRVSDLAHDGPRVGMTVGDVERVLPSLAETPTVDVDVRMLALGPTRLRAALLLPTGHREGDGPYPVVLDPYAGPHAQRVLSARAAYHGSQWLADRGFAVLVVDGRGTPGRGPAFEHAVHGDLAGPALEDQIAALDATAALEPSLDLTRVGIRGWSYGGTLAALAALRRPDRFRCAIVGAPVTDWHLYDTHYTERYLGHPETHPDGYRRSAVVSPDGSLVAPDAVAAGAAAADLLIVHGLVDDNVLAANSLRLTEALHAAGRPFTFLPLTDATHMASDPQVAARLLEVQATFLERCLVAR